MLIQNKRKLFFIKPTKLDKSMNNTKTDLSVTRSYSFVKDCHVLYSSHKTVSSSVFLCKHLRTVTHKSRRIRGGESWLKLLKNISRKFQTSESLELHLFLHGFIIYNTVINSLIVCVLRVLWFSLVEWQVPVGWRSLTKLPDRRELFLFSHTIPLALLKRFLKRKTNKSLKDN